MSHNRRFARLSILLLFVICHAASAQIELLEVGHVQDVYGFQTDEGNGSSVIKLAVNNGFLYAGNDKLGPRIYDLSVPVKPLLISVLTNDFPTADFAFSGPYAYLANSGYGFSIYNISNPRRPVNISSTQLQGGASRLVVSGEQAYIVSEHTLSILNITNPVTPVLLSQTLVPNHTIGITLSGKYAYIMTFHDGFHIFDISDPLQPIALGQINSIGTTGGGSSMVVRDHYAYMANGWDNFHIYDISNPNQPASVSRLGGGSFAQSIVLDGNRAWFADYVRGPVLYDIADPLHPSELASAKTNHGAQSYDVALSGNYAYTANGRDGIRIYKAAAVVAPVQPPPPNDNFRMATTIRTSHAVITATNTLATRELLEPTIAGDSSGHSLWWTWDSDHARSTTIRLNQTKPGFPMTVYCMLQEKYFVKVAEGYNYLNFKTYPNSRYWLVIGSNKGATGTFNFTFDKNPF